MIRFLAILLEVWALFVLCGLGLYLLLGKIVKRSGAVSLALCNCLGLALLGWCATWIVYLNLPAVDTVWSALTLSSCMIGVAVLIRGQSVLWEVPQMFARARRDLDLLAAGGFAAICIFYAGYHHGFGQPYQIGIDEVGYGITADYLARGGSLAAIERDALPATGQPTYYDALNAHITILSFTQSAATEFLLKAQRFTYPMVLAGITNALHLKPLIEYQFCLLAVPLFCATFLLVWFCHDVLRMPLAVAKCIAIAFAVNCNLLAVLYEGQHAQIVIGPYLVLFFGLLYELRGRSSSAECSEWLNGELGLLIITSTALFEFYSESFIALGSFGIILLGLDTLSRDREMVFKSVVFGVGVVCGMLVLGLYCVEWGSFMIRNLENLGAGNGGFWQPHWAYPSEIVGYSSIYQAVVPTLLPRSFGSALEGLVISGWMVLVVISSGILSGRREFNYWIATVLVCVAVWIHLTVLNNYINYGFFKTYTLMLVALLPLHFGSLYRWLEKILQGGRYGTGWAIGLTISAISIPIFVGLTDAMNFSAAAQRAPEGARELRKFDEKADLSRYVILTYPSPEGGIGLAMLGAYVRFNWLNLGWSDLKLRPALDKEVAILIMKKGFANYDSLVRSGRVLVQGSDMILLGTGKKLRDLKAPDVNLVADKPTTMIKWPHAQEPKLSEFMRSYLQGIVRQDRTARAKAETLAER